MVVMLRFPSCGALAALVLLSGCALPEEAQEEEEGTTEARVHVAPDLLVADRHASLTAEVEPDRIRLPVAGNERWVALKPGTLVVAPRGLPDGTNPDGFLRRVLSSSVVGDYVTIVTAPAALTDVIVDGSVRASTAGGRVDDHLTAASSGGTVEVDLADEPLFENVDEITVGDSVSRFTETIRLTRAAVTTRPNVEVDLSVKAGKLTSFWAKLEGNLDASIQAVVDVTSDAPAGAAALAALRERRHTARKVLYESERVALPTFAVGQVPVSTSVKLTVALDCQLSFGGPVHAEAGVEAKSYVRAGGVYRNGEWQPPMKSELDVRPSLVVTGGAETEARCAVETHAELFVYGRSGMEMSVAPYVDFLMSEAVKPSAGFKQAFGREWLYTVQAGATGGMRAKENVFGMAPEELERTLVDWKAGEPLTGTLR